MRWITTAYTTVLGVGIVLVIIALMLRRQHKPLNTALAPMPGTPNAVVAGNDGTTAQVAVEVATAEIPIGHVTKPLSTEEASATTDPHKF